MDRVGTRALGGGTGRAIKRELPTTESLVAYTMIRCLSFTVFVLHIT